MRALVQLIDRYRPGFAAAVVPAQEDIVEQLEELAGPLPGAYRRFLATMGSGMDGFWPLDADFDVEDRLLNYQLNPNLRGSPHLLVAAGGPLEPGGSLYLDRSHPSALDDCMLVVMPPGDPHALDQRQPLHAGLEEFLYVEAYRDVRLAAFPSRNELIPMLDAEPYEATIGKVLELSQELGFERVPPVVSCALLERGDAALVLYRPPDSDDFSFQLGAAEPRELRRLTDLYCSQMPLRVLG